MPTPRAIAFELSPEAAVGGYTGLLEEEIALDNRADVKSVKGVEVLAPFDVVNAKMP